MTEEEVDKGLWGFAMAMLAVFVACPAEILSWGFVIRWTIVRFDLPANEVATLTRCCGVVLLVFCAAAMTRLPKRPEEGQSNVVLSLILPWFALLVAKLASLFLAVLS